MISIFSSVGPSPCSEEEGGEWLEAAVEGDGERGADGGEAGEVEIGDQEFAVVVVNVVVGMMVVGMMVVGIIMVVGGG